MSHTRVKLIVAGLAIATAVALLAMSGVKEGWVYYLPVDEFVADAAYHGQRVRLHGRVAAEGLEVNGTQLLARFDLAGGETKQRVEYTGVIPDNFAADRDVVVEGRLDESGVFRADVLMTKCASKYESGGGEAPHSDPRDSETAR